MAAAAWERAAAGVYQHRRLPLRIDRRRRGGSTRWELHLADDLLGRSRPLTKAERDRLETVDGDRFEKLAEAKGHVADLDYP